jgi:hypothetical protein
VRKTVHNGSFFLLASKLADDNLSDDKDEGIGGTFTAGSFESLSDEFLLRSDCKEGFFDSLNSVSLLFNCIIALSGLLLALLGAAGRCRDNGLASGEGLNSLSSTLGDRDEGLDATSGGATTASETVGNDCFLLGETFLDFANFLASLGEGEGDLEDDDLHDLLARVRKVLETERPVEGLDFSVTSTVAGFLVSFPVGPARSSAESVNLVTVTFPFPLRDALCNNSLLGTYGDCPFLGAAPGV